MKQQSNILINLFILSQIIPIFPQLLITTNTTEMNNHIHICRFNESIFVTSQVNKERLSPIYTSVTKVTMREKSTN